VTEQFRILSWQIEDKRRSVRFLFDCDRFGRFEEQITLPVALPEAPGADALLDLAAPMVGLSYYKAAALPEVLIEPSLTAAGLDAVKALYTEGLGEFYVRNGLFPHAVTVRAPLHPDDYEALGEDTQNTRPILAFGGGKDSHVSADILLKAGLSPEFVSVVLSDTVAAKLSSMANEPITFIRRHLDPKLIELGRSGEALNGHIPITAINSVLLSLYALAQGQSWVVFSNEAGASAPTLVVDGVGVNHQFSKSLAYETLYRDALKSTVGDQLTYFSLLRPLSELAIAKKLAGNVARLQVFASCNRNFVSTVTIEQAQATKWCTECDKCLFTSLILAPHVGADGLVNILGKDTLRTLEFLDQARDLVGLGDQKPWECVGDVTDTSSVVLALAAKPEWEDHQLIQRLAKELAGPLGEANFTARLSARGPSFVPNELQKELE